MGDPVHWLFEARKSPELTALLQLVEQAEIDGRPKYIPRTCRELGRILVCRAYAPALLELYRQVTDPQRLLTPGLQRALREDRRLRDDFQQLLNRTARYCLPRVAAASTGPVTLREIEGFRIRLKPSRVEPDQLFVIIELPDDISFVPGTLFIYESAGTCRKYPLPPQVNGRIQLLTETNSELAEGIRNPKTELFLQ